MDDTAKLIAIILLASFAIERIVAAISFSIDTQQLYRMPKEQTLEQRVKHQRKVVLIVVAGAIAVAVVWLADLRILRVLKLTDAPPSVDFALTWLVLFAGAARIRDFLKGDGGGEKGGRSETPAFRIYVDNNAEVREIPRPS